MLTHLSDPYFLLYIIYPLSKFLWLLQTSNRQICVSSSFIVFVFLWLLENLQTSWVFYSLFLVHFCPEKGMSSFGVQVLPKVSLTNLHSNICPILLGGWFYFLLGLERWRFLSRWSSWSLEVNPIFVFSVRERNWILSCGVLIWHDSFEVFDLNFLKSYRSCWRWISSIRSFAIYGKLGCILFCRGRQEKQWNLRDHDSSYDDVWSFIRFSIYLQGSVNSFVAFSYSLASGSCFVFLFVGFTFVYTL